MIILFNKCKVFLGKPYFLCFSIWGFLTALDQVLKSLAIQNIANLPFFVFPPYFGFTFVTNKGAAWGAFSEFSIVLTLFASAAVVVIPYMMFKQRCFTYICLGLVWSGALGNLIDRFRYGAVVDFIYLWPWPVFNLADLFISTGCVLMIIEQLGLLKRMSLTK